MMGAPLKKIPQRDGSMLWTYSNRSDVTCSFLRRWVYLENDKIKFIDNDYWEE